MPKKSRVLCAKNKIVANKKRLYQSDEIQWRQENIERKMIIFVINFAYDANVYVCLHIPRLHLNLSDVMHSFPIESTFEISILSLSWHSSKLWQLTHARLPIFDAIAFPIATNFPSMSFKWQSHSAFSMCVISTSKPNRMHKMLMWFVICYLFVPNSVACVLS